MGLQIPIYKSVAGKKEILKLYDEQLGRLSAGYSDKQYIIAQSKINI